jgi:hypothetical protein
MNELMIILTKCFDVLYANKKDLSWSNKYYSRYKEEELLEQLAELEEIHQNDQKRNPRLAYVSFFFYIENQSFSDVIKRQDRREKIQKKNSYNPFRVHQVAKILFHLGQL